MNIQEHLLTLAIFQLVLGTSYLSLNSMIPPLSLIITGGMLLFLYVVLVFIEWRRR